MNNEQVGEKTPFEKTVTREGLLFGWRAIVLVLSAAMTVISWFIQGGVSDIKASIAEIRHDVAALDRRYNEDRILTIDRLGKIEGTVGALSGSVETHRKRLEELDVNGRAVWQRLFEIGRSRPNPNPKPDSP